MTKEFKKNRKTFWNEMLNGEKLLSDREADELTKTVRAIRKERGFKFYYQDRKIY